MNKYVVLTSVFALAACGGGGGTDFVPSAPRGPASSATVASNSKITSLATEILVTGGDVKPVVLRSGSVAYNGDNYRSYRLEDVKLKIAGENDNQYMQFLINKSTGEIDRISKMDTSVSGNRPVNTNRMKDSAGNMLDNFGGPVFEFVPNGASHAVVRVADDGSMTYNQLANRYTPKNIAGRWNRIDERVALHTYGKEYDKNDATAQLQYSDFGKFNPIYISNHKSIYSPTSDFLSQIRNYEKTGQNKLERGGGLDDYRTEEEWNALANNADGYMFFAGGYAINDAVMVDTLAPGSSTEYNGTAIARVRKGDTSKDFITKDATLSIDADGNQKLTMPFNASDGDKFYNVTVTNPESATFEFGAHDGVDDAYLRDCDTPGVVANVPTNVQKNWNSGFYGIDNPSEAAGTLHYSETVSGTESGNPFENRVWEFQGAYGTKLSE